MLRKILLGMLAVVCALGVVTYVQYRIWLAETMERANSPGSLSTTVLEGYKRLLQARISTPAFHPDGPCELIDMGDPALFSIVRTSPNAQQRVQVVVNLSRSAVYAPTGCG